MSTKSVTAFRTKLAAEPALVEKVRELVAAGSGNEALVALARTQGFEFTSAEVDEALNESELSELELELISGGNECGNSMV